MLPDCSTGERGHGKQLSACQITTQHIYGPGWGRINTFQVIHLTCRQPQPWVSQFFFVLRKVRSKHNIHVQEQLNGKCDLQKNCLFLKQQHHTVTCMVQTELESTPFNLEPQPLTESQPFFPRKVQTKTQYMNSKRENLTWLVLIHVHTCIHYLQKLAWLLLQSLQEDNFPDLLEHALSYSKCTGLDNYKEKL